MINNYKRVLCGAIFGAAFISAVPTTLIATANATTSLVPSCGIASWYDLTSRTASGEMMDPSKLTAAHKKLRFGTKLRVENLRNGKSVIVRINDRGPFTKGRFIDLSKAAAQKLGFINAGTAKVCINILK